MRIIRVQSASTYEKVPRQSISLFQISVNKIYLRRYTDEVNYQNNY